MQAPHRPRATGMSVGGKGLVPGLGDKPRLRAGVRPGTPHVSLPTVLAPLTLRGHSCPRGWPLPSGWPVRRDWLRGLPPSQASGAQAALGAQAPPFSAPQVWTSLETPGWARQRLAAQGALEWGPGHWGLAGRGVGGFLVGRGLRLPPGRLGPGG